MERNWQQQNFHRGADGGSKSTAIDPKATIALIDESTFRLLKTFNAKNMQLNPRNRCSSSVCQSSTGVCCLMLTKYREFCSTVLCAGFAGFACVCWICVCVRVRCLYNDHQKFFSWSRCIPKNCSHAGDASRPFLCRGLSRDRDVIDR